MEIQCGKCLATFTDFDRWVMHGCQMEARREHWPEGYEPPDDDDTEGTDDT